MVSNLIGGGLALGALTAVLSTGCSPKPSQGDATPQPVVQSILPAV